MSLELSIFVLRLLAGASLVAFLLALFIIIWRSFRQLEQLSTGAKIRQGFLVRLEPQAADAVNRWALSQLVTLGRAESNTIVAQDDFASAEHARIVYERGGWWLEDRQSRNGTRLNDIMLSKRALLADGDIIGIGNHRFRVEMRG